MSTDIKKASRDLANTDGFGGKHGLHGIGDGELDSIHLGAGVRELDRGHRVEFVAVNVNVHFAGGGSALGLGFLTTDKTGYATPSITMTPGEP